MNTKDARVKGTRKAIRESFLELLRKKPVSRVTVKEICEMSEINRSTFYKHYSDPLDVLEKMEEEILEKLADSLQPALSDMRAYLDLVLLQMETQGNVYRLLASERGDMAFPTKIFECCYKTVFPRFGSNFPELTVSQRDMVYQYLAQGSGGVLGKWMDGGMREPRETVIALLLQLNAGAVSGLQVRAEDFPEA